MLISLQKRKNNDVSFALINHEFDIFIKEKTIKISKVPIFIIS